jgi:hypothetical protein
LQGIGGQADCSGEIIDVDLIAPGVTLLTITFIAGLLASLRK